MSEQRPYNEEYWNDLPLPDGEMAWQKMELLLDKEKKRRVLPFWWRFACLAILVAGVSTGVWLWITGNSKTGKSFPVVSQQTVNDKVSQRDITEELPLVVNDKRDEKTLTTIPPRESPRPTETEEAIKTTKNLNKDVRRSSNATTSINSKRNRTISGNKGRTKSPDDLPPKSDVLDRPGAEKEMAVSKEKKNTTTGESTIPHISPPGKSDDTKQPPVDSSAIKHNIQAPVTGNDSTQKQKAKTHSFVWSAGIGLQQSIAVNGQQSSSYNYHGKRAGVSDHLPSVYVRLQRGAWFAQAEFQYGVPQPVTNFAFSQKTKFDAASLSVNTERFTIQKLYYHQLPVSINYHVLPNVSVGVGAMYNILAGAVTQQEISSKNVQTGNESLSKSLAPVKGFKDSFLYKTTAGILVQTDYHWKRFSLGLRFTQNLQPFIKYTKPDGTLIDEKTNALQAILRFRLWSGK